MQITNNFKTRRTRVNIILWCTVIIPTVLAIIYYGLIASDVYISESRFVVRSPQRQTQTGLGALLQGTGFARSQDDTYSVHDFVLSRDALKELDDQPHGGGVRLHRRSRPGSRSLRPVGALRHPRGDRGGPQDRNHRGCRDFVFNGGVAVRADRGGMGHGDGVREPQRRC